MKIETKLGLFTILILLCVFSYVVYEKWEERNAIIAAGGDPDAQEVAEQEPGQENGESSPTTPEDLFAKTEGELKKVSAEAPLSETPQGNEDDLAFNDPTEANFVDNSQTEPSFDQSFDDDSPFANDAPPQELAQSEDFDPAAEFGEQGDDVFGSETFEEETAEFGGDVAMNNEQQFEDPAPQEFAEAPAAPDEFESFDANELNEFNQEEPVQDNFAENENEEPLLDAFDDTAETFAATEEPLVDEFAENTPEANRFEDQSEEIFEAQPEPTTDAFADEEEFAATPEEAAPFEEFSADETTMKESTFPPVADAGTFEDVAEEGAFEGTVEEGTFEEFSSPSKLAQLQNEPQDSNEEALFDEPESIEEAPFAEEVAANEPEFATEDAGSAEADLGFDEPELEVARLPGQSAFSSPEMELTQNNQLTRQNNQPLFDENEGFYQVQGGDNLWKISKKLYGSGKYANALAMFNRKVLPSPSKLKLGMQLETPQLAELKQFWMKSQQNVAEGNSTEKDPFAQQEGGFFVREETGEPYYVIQPEDTLTGIAQRHLGRASRWIQIVALNKSSIKDPKTLKPGTTLRLPADASPVQLSSGSFETDRR